MSYRKNSFCFSLLHGGEVRLAPALKVLPADQFSTLQTAEQLLVAVQADSEKYRKEVVRQAEKIKEAAAQEGYEAGFLEWAEAVAALEEKVLQLEKKYQEIVLPVALAAAKKIVARELDRNDKAILDIIANSLKAVAQHKKITIWVNPDQLEVVEGHRPHLKTLFEALQQLSIRPREDVAPGGCIIETEGGIINAQLSNLWEALELAFDKMKEANHSAAGGEATASSWDMRGEGS